MTERTPDQPCMTEEPAPERMTPTDLKWFEHVDFVAGRVKGELTHEVHASWLERDKALVALAEARTALRKISIVVSTENSGSRCAAIARAVLAKMEEADD